VVAATGTGTAVANCAPGEIATGGGGQSADPLTASVPVGAITSPTGWQASVADPGTTVTAVVVCAP